MDVSHHTVTITVYDKKSIYNKVNSLLHDFAENILLRVGYPFPEENAAIIFLILKLNNEELGSFTGKLGQLKEVKVKSSKLNM